MFERGIPGMVAGLDIGDVYACVSEVETDPQGRCASVRGGWVAIDPDAPDQAVASAIGALWQKAGVRRTVVASCLRSSAMITHHFSLPAMSDAELHSALILEAESALQLPAGEIAVKWHIQEGAGGHAGGAAQGREGILVAVPRKEVDRHTAILDAAGLYPVIVDIGSLAVANLYLQAVPRTGTRREAICIANLYARSVDMVVVFDGQSAYPRTVFAQSAGWDDGIGYLADSLRDMFRYQQYKLRQDPVSVLWLTGMVPSYDGFVDRLRELLGVPVCVWDPVSNVQSVTMGPTPALGKYPSAPSMMSCAMGLALRREP